MFTFFVRVKLELTSFLHFWYIRASLFYEWTYEKWRILPWAESSFFLFLIVLSSLFNSSGSQTLTLHDLKKDDDDKKTWEKVD